MAFLFSLVAIVTWLVQFFVRFRSNVLMREDIKNGGWNSARQATVGYSFWMVFLASVIFFVNSAIVLLRQRKRARRRAVKSQVIESGKPNGNLMLY